MKNMKKKFIAICISALILLFAKFSWDEFFSYIFLWTKTDFASHQEYIELLEDHHCFASVFFIKEKPMEFAEGRYYWRHKLHEIFTAYSIEVKGESYEKIKENRIDAYYNQIGKDTDTVIYVLQNDEYLYIEDAEWYDKANLKFINEVVLNPEMQQQYYFLIVVGYNTSHGTSYTGVILNDNTREVIEFNVELPDKYLQSN